MTRRARQSSAFAASVASWFAAALVGSGCSLLTDPGRYQVANRCSTSAECGLGARCDSSGACVASAPPPYAVLLEMTPATDPLGGAPVPMLFDVGMLDGSPVEIVAPLPVPVQGTARLDGNPISAQLTFVPRRGEGPRNGELAEPLSVRASASTNGTVDFVTQLPGGASYDVFVEPQNEDRARLPPLTGMLEVPTGAGVSFAVAYASDELATIEGTVLDADRVPREGLVVRAIDPASGRSLSSVTTTDESGRFRLVMLRGTTRFAFRVRSDGTRQEAGTVFPKLTIDASTLMPDARGAFTLLVPTPDRAIRLEGRVELPASRGVGLPAANARVRLEATSVQDPSTGLTGSLEVDTTTDAEGRFRALVLPGVYQVEVTSSDEAVGVLVETLEILPNPAAMILGQLFTLPERSVLGGTVQLPTGEPVSGNIVRATALGLADGTSAAARLARSASGRTGSMGEFRLPLDVGVYDLVVELPPESGFAWHVEPGFAVGSAGAPLRRVMSVRAPHRLEATARFVEGSPLAGARVRAFALDARTGRGIELGRAECDASGRFTVLLPGALD